MTSTCLTRSLVLATTAALMFSAPSVTQAAAPAAPAKVTVTIAAEGTDIFGTVKSPRRACKARVEVRLMKVVGSRGGGDDSFFASDTTDLQDGVWSWATGQLGTEGRFYARVRPTDVCKGAASRTIRVEREE